MDYEREAIESYIQVRHPWAMKNDISVFRWFTVIFLPLSLWGCFFHPWFQAVIVASSLVILLGGWKISTDVEEYQKLHILYLGITAFLLSVITFLVSIAMFENMLGFEPIRAGLVIGAGYLFVLIGGGYYHIRMVKQGYFSSANNQKKAGKKSSKWWALAAILPGVMMTFTVVMKSMFGELYLKSTAIWAPIFSYLCLCGTVYLHKYYLMKKFEQHVKVHKLDKKSSGTAAHKKSS